MTIPRFEISDGYTISRIIKGGWHLAGGHGHVDKHDAIEDMRAFVDAGITTFDCADIYTGVEELIGEFLKKYQTAIRNNEMAPVQVHTKYVPDHDALADLTAKDTVKIIDRSLRRLGVEQLDLVQYCWWDFDVPGYVETALVLKNLQGQGKVRHIGVTNVDALHLNELLDAGVDVVSNQVQYSVLDHRPEIDFAGMEIPLLCYGVLAGGFLSDHYLKAEAENWDRENRSLVKYQLIIDEYGGFEPYRNLLATLLEIGKKYQVSISDVAAGYIMQKSSVAGLIIGARNRDHLDKYHKIFSFQLEENDLDLIKRHTTSAAGPGGPVYELERDRDGPHGSIMRYNLNHQRG